MTEFMRPKITVEEVDENIARFVMEPLERGYGQTLWTVRRRLLSRSRVYSMSSPLLLA